MAENGLSEESKYCRAARRWGWSDGLLLMLLTSLVIGVHFTRMTTLTLRGEETRRATVAMGMRWTDDWVVPRQQGEPVYMSTRPPLQNWCIALGATIRGACDRTAVRTPSVLALLLLSWCIYGYGRAFMAPLGAFAASAGFATMGQILELGSTGETDLLFSVFLAGALLSWHIGYMQRRSPWLVWMVGYMLTALATMTKGPQAPCYFAGAVGLYLLLVRDWRFAFSWAHLGGIGLFAAVLGSWVVPYVLATDAATLQHAFVGDVLINTVHYSWGEWFVHLVSFPAELLIGCLFPWSLLLIAYFHRDMRAAVADARPYLLFLVGAIFIAFPTVWLAAGAKTRMFMPLYPCFALLAGLVVDRCCRATASVRLYRHWRRFAAAAGIAVPIAGVTVLVKTFVAPSMQASQPIAWAASYTLIALALGLALTRYVFSKNPSAARHALAVFFIAAFVGLTWTGVRKNYLVYRSARVDLDVAALRERLPDNVELVSLAPIPHLFAYHFNKPIKLMELDAVFEEPTLAGEYFCFDRHWVEVPFAFETVAEIRCRRQWNWPPYATVVVGRRSPGPLEP